MKTINRLLLFLLSVTLIQTYIYSQWVSVSSGSSDFLTSGYYINARNCYVTGSGGTILKSTNAGSSWTALTGPAVTGINKICATDSANIWIAANSGFYKTTNGGINWTAQINTGKYVDTYFSGAGTGFALGDTSIIMRTTNGGASFAPLQYAPNVNIKGICASFAGGDTLFVLGGKSTFDSSFVYKTTDGGITWSLSFKTADQFLSIAFFNSSNGFICGPAGAVFRTSNGGASWVTVSSGTTFNLLGSKVLSSGKGYIVGIGGVILKTTNSGQNWELFTGNGFTLKGIAVSPTGDTAIASGIGGTILRTINGGLTGVVQSPGDVPRNYSLSQNFPNPFNPSTKISFTIPKSPLTFGEGNAPSVRGVRLCIYDMLGREAALLVNESLQPGTYEIEFDASKLPSGTYFYRLSAGEFTQTKKMALIK